MSELELAKEKNDEAWREFYLRNPDIFVEDCSPLFPAHFSEPTKEEATIGKYCAELIEDGACLQMGIGAIPNAVLAQLGNHKDLGIHTEMFADGVLPLVENGVYHRNARNHAAWYNAKRRYKCASMRKHSWPVYFSTAAYFSRPF